MTSWVFVKRFTFTLRLLFLENEATSLLFFVIIIVVSSHIDVKERRKRKEKTGNTRKECYEAIQIVEICVRLRLFVIFHLKR
jgi:sensor domain CHASE-containing protein